MAAGQGFKTFTTGEVLTAGDVNGYLMQGINVFASNAARDAAITAPAEGQFAFTKDTNSLWYYDGAAWVASGATGDIEGVTAGVGISGGGTSGTVTVTNSMATAIDAKGDLVPGTGADTFARLAVGANDTVLTADSSTATGLKWAAPAAGGGMTLLSTTTLSGATVTLSSISQSYKNLYIVIQGVTNATNNGFFRMKVNNVDFCNTLLFMTDGTSFYNRTDRQDSYRITASADRASTFNNANNAWAITINNYTSTTGRKPISHCGIYYDPSTLEASVNGVGGFDSNNAITSLVFSVSSGNLLTGTVLLYGVN